MTKKAFSLLEILIAISLIILSSSYGGWKIYRLVEKKRFDAALEKLASQLKSGQKIALTMQADWVGILQKEKDHWVFQLICVEQEKAPRFSKIIFPSLQLFCEEKNLEKVVFEFSSTGEIYPMKEFVFLEKKGGAFKKTLKMEELFQKAKENKKDLGPLHPKILRK